MNRRELLKGLVSLLFLPLVSLLPRYAPGGIVSGAAPLVGEGGCTMTLPYNLDPGEWVGAHCVVILNGEEKHYTVTGVDDCALDLEEKT